MCAWMQEAAKKLQDTTKPLIKRLARLETSIIVRVCTPVLSVLQLAGTVHFNHAIDHICWLHMQLLAAQ